MNNQSHNVLSAVKTSLAKLKNPILFVLLAGIYLVPAVSQKAQAVEPISERRLMLDVNSNGIVDSGDQPLSYQPATLLGLVSGPNEHFARQLATASSDMRGVVRFDTHAADGQSLIVPGFRCTTHQMTLLCSPAFEERSLSARNGTVYFIYFIPQDSTLQPEIRDRIWTLAQGAQANYLNFIGSTYPIYYKTLVIRGERNREYYSQTPDDIHSRCEFYYIGNIWKEIRDRIGGEDWDPDHRFVIYSDVDICSPSSHYAAANLGTAHLPANATMTDDLMGDVGAMVTNHELGHAFFLAHSVANLDNCMYPTVRDNFPCLFDAGQVDEMLTNNPGFWGNGGVDRELPNDDGEAPLPEISVTSTWFSEGDQTASVLFELSEASSEEVSVLVYTISDTARGHGVDYRGFTETLVYAPGETEKRIEFDLVDDEYPEADEDIRVRMTSPVGATLDRAEALFRIIDDDVVQDGVFVEPMFVLENIAGPANVIIRLTNPQDRPVAVKFKTEDDEALNGIDYYGNYEQLYFAPGEISKSVPVKIIDDDLREPDKSLKLRVFDADNASLIGDGRMMLKIVDDESI